jgi:hypothetical protein
VRQSFATEAAAWPVHIRKLHLGARHQPAQPPQYEPHTPFGQTAQFVGLRVPGHEEHLHRNLRRLKGGSNVAPRIVWKKQLRPKPDIART